MAMTCSAQPGPRLKSGRLRKMQASFDELAVTISPFFFTRVVPVLALGLELPLVGGEALGGLLDATVVLFVDEVRPVATTALHQLGRRPGEHALTAVAEDAGPVAFQEGHVEHPGSLAL